MTGAEILAWKLFIHNALELHPGDPFPQEHLKCRDSITGLIQLPEVTVKTHLYLKVIKGYLCIGVDSEDITNPAIEVSNISNSHIDFGPLGKTCFIYHKHRIHTLYENILRISDDSIK